jgi:hypothetical protein
MLAAPGSPAVVAGIVTSGMLICTTLVLVTASVAVVLEALASSPVSLDELHPTATSRTNPVSAAILCIMVV